MPTAYERKLARNRARGARWKAEGRCYECGGEKDGDYLRCAKCRTDALATNKRVRARQFAAVLAAYGGACACCGETTPAFLTIDHVDGGGAEHRREVGRDIYRWLVREGFPDGFRLLCWNCNCGRERNGGMCPHETQRAAVVPIRAVE